MELYEHPNYNEAAETIITIVEQGARTRVLLARSGIKSFKNKEKALRYIKRQLHVAYRGNLTLDNLNQRDRINGTSQ